MFVREAARSMIADRNAFRQRLLTVVPLLVTIATTLYLYTVLRNSHPFVEDYAVYLQQAWNIAHHVPMTDMGVIQYYDPNLPLLYFSPLTYPPLLPLLYALPVAYFGFDLMLFKVIQLGLLAGGLFLFCYAMRRWRFSVVEISVSILMFSFSYEVRRSVNSISTDLPFILFLILGLLSIQKFIGERGRKLTIWGMIAGVTIFLAIDLRMVAVALLPTLLVADVLAHRRLRLLSLVVPVSMVAVLQIGQSVIMHPDFSYGIVIHHRFFTPIENAQQFYWSLFGPLAQSAFPGLAEAALLVLTALAAIGVAFEAARGMVMALFIIAYTALLLVLPDLDSGARYLVPHLLVLGAFGVRGATLIARLFDRGRGPRPVLPIGVAAIALVWCVLVPSPRPAGAWDFGVMAAPARETFAFLRDHTPSTAIIAATKYRSFHLFTQRTTIQIPTHHTAPELTKWFSRYGVTAIVVKHSPAVWKYDFSDCPGLPLCRPDTLGPNVKEVFRNSDYMVFAVLPAAGTAPAPPLPSTPP
jgi:hypothetical protein